MRNRQKPNESPANGEATVVWGREVEQGDFLKVPRALLCLHRYRDGLKWLKPRHLTLLLVLAGRKFQNKPIRVYWEELANDLGVNRDTVRKWAYQLEDKGLLRIRRIKGRDPDNNRVGVRNDRNAFDLSPFITIVKEAWSEKRRSRPVPQRGQGDE
jgi:hypothetical protein